MFMCSVCDFMDCYTFLEWSQVRDWYTHHSQKWWVLCSFAYLRWRRRDVCNFHMIYIDDIIHNCMCVICWTWKWYIESSWIKWNKNFRKQLNIRGSWTKWKSEATNPFLALRVYVKMSEIHETGGVWHRCP
jgi:hypothetical protein